MQLSFYKLITLLF